MPDAAFESAFSELAHASLRDKSPGLMEYLVGFQILDKNDEDTHAVAVFGFKVGSQWFYAPTFFMNGALKGSDLLYVKGQDLFVPLQDNWVNYLLSKRPNLLGQPEPKEESELNIEVPTFNVFAESPTSGGGSSSKWASLDTSRTQDWVKDFLPAYSDAVLGKTTNEKRASFVNRFDLKQLFIDCPVMAAPFAETMATNTKFAEAVFRFYDDVDFIPDINLVKSALEEAYRALEPSAALEKPIKPKKVQKGSSAPVAVTSECKEASSDVGGLTLKMAADASEEAEELEDQTKINDEDLGTVTAYTAECQPEMIAGDGGSQQLTDAEKEQLIKGEIVIRDSRAKSQKSKVYNADFERCIQNPGQTGVYDVLAKSGEFKRMLVIVKPKPVGRGRVAGIVTLAGKDGEYGNYPTTDIFVSRGEVGGQSFEANINEFLDDGVALGKMRPGFLYVLVAPNGQGTIPFKFLESTANNDGTVQLRVSAKENVTRTGRLLGQHPSCYSGGYNRQEGPGIWMDDNGDSYNDDCCCPISYDDEKKSPYTVWEYKSGKNILSSDRDSVSRMHIVGSTLVVPANTKAIEIGDDRREGSGPQRAKQVTTLDPGTLLDVETYILKQGAHQIDVILDGPEIVIRHENGQMRLEKSAAVFNLVKKWGLDVDDARHMVKAAKSKRIQQYWVKFAAGPPTSPDMMNAPAAPPMPPYPSRYSNETGTPIVEHQQDFLEVPGLQEQPGNRAAYKLMDDPDVQGVLQAAESGKKDIFDTSVVGSLVKAVDVDSIIDSYLPDIIRGMDRVGRILFMFYWHNESFRDRYGRQELMDMEDALRNVFKSQGDLVIFLKQKTIEADPLDEAMAVDIGALA